MSKHSAQARFARIARASLKRCGLLKVRDKDVCLVDLRKTRLVKATPTQAAGLDQLPFKWRVHLFVCAQDTNGKRKLVHEFFDAPAPYTRENLAEAARDVHYEICKDQKGILRSVAWLAAPHGDDVDTEAMFNLLDSEFNAWDPQLKISVKS